MDPLHPLGALTRCSLVHSTLRVPVALSVVCLSWLVCVTSPSSVSIWRVSLRITVSCVSCGGMSLCGVVFAGAELCGVHVRMYVHVRTYTHTHVHVCVVCVTESAFVIIIFFIMRLSMRWYGGLCLPAVRGALLLAPWEVCLKKKNEKNE